MVSSNDFHASSSDTPDFATRFQDRTPGSVEERSAWNMPTASFTHIGKRLIESSVTNGSLRISCPQRKRLAYLEFSLLAVSGVRCLPTAREQVGFHQEYFEHTID